MQDTASSVAGEYTRSALQAVPVAAVGSTILGYTWSDFVNVLASVSIALQVLWFVYDKVWLIVHRAKERSFNEARDTEDHG